jgi:ribosome maturation factor RimP
MIDSDEALTIEQCRSLNKHLSNKLDELDFGDTPYKLEVSSPGIDKPLLLARQYAKHIGRELQITLKAKTELIGKFESFENNIIKLHLKDKKKAYKAKEPIMKEISIDEIEKTLVLVSFN